MHRFLFFLLPLLVLSPAGRLDAQISDSRILAVKIHYDELQYERAVATGNRLLTGGGDFSPGDLAFLHRYMALANYNLGRQDSSRSHFRSLLSLRPDLRLDPAEVSPKIIEFFDGIRAEMETAQPGTGFTRYVMVEDDRREALWRSALVPGWGQVHKGQWTRGLLVGGLFWGSVAALTWNALEEGDARDAYTAAVFPDDIAARYDDYNGYHRARQWWTVAAVSLWALNAVDAGWGPRSTPRLDRDGLSLSLQWTVRRPPVLSTR